MTVIAQGGPNSHRTRRASASRATKAAEVTVPEDFDVIIKGNGSCADEKHKELRVHNPDPIRYDDGRFCGNCFAKWGHMRPGVATATGYLTTHNRGLRTKRRFTARIVGSV